MIRCDISGRNFEPDTKVKDYVTAKIGGLEKYLPRRARGTAYAEVKLELDPSGREDNQYVCTATVYVPDGPQKSGPLKSREGTINIYAAIDIVEAKLRHQLQAYKDKNVTEPRRARMLSRWIGRVSETDPATPEAEAE